MGTSLLSRAFSWPRLDAKRLAPILLGAAAFVLLFAKPARLLALDWWNDPEAGHGLLLAPVAAWLIWRKGLLPERVANPPLGIVMLGAAVLLRLASELAAELFTMRGAMIGAAMGLVVFAWGWKQLMAWWLPTLLVILSVPLPELIRSAVALPLQFQASEFGAALLELRQVPVRLSGNIIMLPGHQLFVTEACSGLRSLTALLSLSVLMGGLWFKRWPTGVLLIAAAVPIAILINGVRVFLTGFLVYYVDPAMGEGFMHLTEGWLLFLVSFALVGIAAWILVNLERAVLRWRSARA